MRFHVKTAKRTFFTATLPVIGLLVSSCLDDDPAGPSQDPDPTPVATVETLTTITGPQTYDEAERTYVILNPVTIISAVTFGSNTKLRAEGAITVGAGGTLEFQASSQAHFSKDAGITASGGPLKIAGTPTARVTMAPLSAEAWAGLTVSSGGAGSSIAGLNLSGAAQGVSIDSAVVNITNSRITDCRGTGVTYSGTARPEKLDGSGFAGNVVMNCDSLGMVVNPNAVGYLGANDSLLDTIKIVRGEPVLLNQTWRPQPLPYLVAVTLDVESECVLTIAAGTRFLFAMNAGIEVGERNNGTVMVAGTEAAPVTMSPLDTTFGWTAQGTSIDEGAFIFYGSSVDCAITHLHLKGSMGSGIWVRDAIVNITNTTVSHCGKSGVVYAGAGRPEKLDGSGFAGNTITDCREAALRVQPNAVGYLASNAGIGDTCEIVLNLGEQPSGDQTWRRQPFPYLVSDDIRIEKGGVTIEPGLEFLFKKSAGMVVGDTGTGVLKIDGTAEAPVVMAGVDATWGWYAEDASQDASLVFGSGAGGSYAKHLRFSNAAKNGIYVQQSSIQLENVTILECMEAGLYLDSGAGFPAAAVTISNSTISECVQAIFVGQGSTLTTDVVTFSGNGAVVVNE